MAVAWLVATPKTEVNPEIKKIAVKAVRIRQGPKQKAFVAAQKAATAGQTYIAAAPRTPASKTALAASNAATPPIEITTPPLTVVARADEPHHIPKPTATSTVTAAALTDKPAQQSLQASSSNPKGRPRDAMALVRLLRAPICYTSSSVLFNSNDAHEGMLYGGGKRRRLDRKPSDSSLVGSIPSATCYERQDDLSLLSVCITARQPSGDRIEQGYHNTRCSTAAMVVGVQGHRLASARPHYYSRCAICHASTLSCLTCFFEDQAS